MMKFRSFCLRLAFSAPAALLTFSLFTTSLVWAQSDELVSVQFESVVKAKSSNEAIREATSKAMSEVAREQIIQIIGEKKYQKSKAPIEARIVREAAKFIPLVNPGAPQAAGESFKVPVDLKVSVGSLKKMLLDAGLLHDGETSASLVPLISFQDRVNTASYRWWLADSGEKTRFLAQLSRQLNESLYEALTTEGFYLLRPQTSATVALIPPPFRLDRLATEDLRVLTDHLRAQLVIRGDVRFRPSKTIAGGVHMAIRLDVYHPANARVIAEVVRNFETEPGAFEGVVRSRAAAAFPDLSRDLAAQIVEVWQKGTLNSTLVQLAVRGNLNPKQLGEFKNSLLKSVREAKSAKERMFGPGEVTFEVDYSGGSQQLADRIRGVSVPGFTVNVAGVTPQGVVIDVRGSSTR